MRIFALALALMATACTQFPELDAASGTDWSRVDYPRLLPLDQILTQTEFSATPQMQANVQTRLAGLRARASRLRGGVIDPATRQRMQLGVSGTP